MEQSTKSQEIPASAKGNAEFQPPRLTPLGRVNDLTKDFVTPGSGDFTLTGFMS